MKKPAPIRSFVLTVCLLFVALASPGQLVSGVDAVGITVSDMDRAVDFYSKVLTFQKVSDTEVAGDRRTRFCA